MRTWLSRARPAAAALPLLWLAACRPPDAGSAPPAPPAGAPAAAAPAAAAPLPGPALPGPDSAAVRARIDRVFARFDRPGSPGCLVTVMRAGDIVFARGYGSADVERGTPFTPASAFDGASMAKQFMAFGIGLLARDGKLSLDDPVRKHLPELPDHGALTLRHLVHHTSGLRDWEARTLSGRDDLDPAMLPGLSFPPGEDHVYDDTGYDLLQRVLERVSGKTWLEFARERIWDPLEMRSTGRSPLPRRIPAYRPAADGSLRLSMTPPDEGFTTTPEDLARWDRNFYDARIGGPELVRLAAADGRLNDGESIPYAFGLHTEPYRGLRRVWHGGLSGGYRSQFMRFPEQRTSVLTVCNVFGLAEPNALTERVADIVLEDAIRAAGERAGAPAEPPAAAPGAEPAPARLAGVYLDRPGQGFRAVRLRDGRLEMRHWITWYPLRPLGGGRFRVEGQPLTVAFLEGGGRTRLEEAWDGRRSRRVYEAAPAHPLPAAELSRYAGTFRSGELGATWRLAAGDGRLRLRNPPRGVEPFVPVARDAFLSADYFLLLFERDAAGRITGFRVATPRTRDLVFAKQGP